ncbi:NAD(P)-dependent oxidoreductase [Pedobacter agri]|uniref:NAD-dependent epimerase/dehydratase family protein n=1 Tax=Pedobacter agri TaxID=454586 RepID=UPI002930F00D|nr:NAD(P)-dependent oxidoreductase [Pedobacter agri]
MGDLKTILITGGSGYLGKNLVKFFAKDGHEIILLVRENSNVDYLDQLHGNFIIHRIGSTDLEELFIEKKVDVIIHTAASYGRKGESLSNVIDANLTFPVRLLDIAIKNGVKFFINTDTALPKELNAYSRSKKQFLEWLESLSKDINVINLQLEYFYGPYDDQTKFITYLLGELASGKKSIDFTDATPLRDFIYIDDVVNAYATVFNQLDNFKEITTVQVGSGNAVMLKELILEVQRIANRLEVQLNFGALSMRPNEIMKSCADNSFLKKMGWQPQHSFEEGIQKTIELEKN